MPNVGEAARALNFRGYVSDETPPGSPDVRQVNMVQVGPVPYLPPVRDVALPSAVGGRENRENPGLPVFPPPEGYWVWTGRRILYAANEEEEAQIWATYGEETPLWEGYDPYDSDDDFDQPIGNPAYNRPVGGDVHVPVNPPGFAFPEENHQGPIGEGGQADSVSNDGEELGPPMPPGEERLFAAGEPLNQGQTLRWAQGRWINVTLAPNIPLPVSEGEGGGVPTHNVQGGVGTPPGTPLLRCLKRRKIGTLLIHPPKMRDRLQEFLVSRLISAKGKRREIMLNPCDLSMVPRFLMEMLPMKTPKWLGSGRKVQRRWRIFGLEPFQGELLGKN
jgi:hypothetical protein